ncbi:MAG: MFS transporter [Pirellulaceae bacterium]|nr:MFS transporter [Pirellulaceae bacterium]
MKWRQLVVLAAVQWLAMALWFSASAVHGALKEEWSLSPTAVSWLTISVQLGFVVGALASAILNLSDRIKPTILLAVCALLGAAVNLVIPLAITTEQGKTASGFTLVIALRMLTGIMLAGVYPTGMKLMATWFASGRGLAIGVLVGALTLGSASPQFINALALGTTNWRWVMGIASALSGLSSILAILFARVGPHLASAAKFDWQYFARIWQDPAVRRANFGYLGHMFELYAMWAWAPKLLAQSYAAFQWSERDAALAGFATIAIGGVGCVLAGAWADRVGRTWTTIASLAVSGSCALIAGHLVDYPFWLTIVCLIWGFSVVADSAQFSTAISELCDPRYIGTALTIQTCAGFLLTTLTIYAVPTIQSRFGWPAALSLLALGPVFGIWHMARLRSLPAASKMAGGRK